jgi:DNA mismatch endonuclease (patch repair protein)
MFWADKFEANVMRDRQQQRDLKKLGWKVRVIWECQAREVANLDKLIRRMFLASPVRNN